MPPPRTLKPVAGGGEQALGSEWEPAGEPLNLRGILGTPPWEGLSALLRQPREAPNAPMDLVVFLTVFLPVFLPASPFAQAATVALVALLLALELVHRT